MRKKRGTENSGHSVSRSSEGERDETSVPVRFVPAENLIFVPEPIPVSPVYDSGLSRYINFNLPKKKIKFCQECHGR